MMSSTLSRTTFSKSCRSKCSKFLSVGVPSNVNRRREHDCRNRRRLSTYYDSQSGLHLPIHDETEIRLFLDVSAGYQQSEDDKLPFIPHNLNKDRVKSDEVSEKLQQMIQQGIHGMILPAIKFPRDIRNLHTLAIIAPPSFTFLSNNCSETNASSKHIDDCLLKAKELSSSATNFSKVLRYQNEEELQETLQRSVDKGLHTTLSMTEDIYAGDGDDVEPITLANNIATVIDKNGGCDYIWISSEQQNEQQNSSLGDTIVHVCEELVYLDVAGATIKSRLIVDSLNEDMLEDIMFAGVNKYVIESENQAEMVDTIAKEQGKALLRL